MKAFSSCDEEGFAKGSVPDVRITPRLIPAVFVKLRNIFVIQSFTQPLLPGISSGFPAGCQNDDANQKHQKNRTRDCAHDDKVALTQGDECSFRCRGVRSVVCMNRKKNVSVCIGTTVISVGMLLKHSPTQAGIGASHCPSRQVRTLGPSSRKPTPQLSRSAVPSPRAVVFPTRSPGRTGDPRDTDPQSGEDISACATRVLMSKAPGHTKSKVSKVPHVIVLFQM